MSRILALLVVAAGCGTDPEPDVPGFTPDRACPGDVGCEPTDDVVFRAGAALTSIVPSCFETWEDRNDNLTWQVRDDAFLDCGCDRLCPEDEGYPGPDEGEGDGSFQQLWMGGGDANRPVMGVRTDGGLRGEGDGLWARTVVFEQGNTRVALVALDSLGLQYDDTLRTRELLDERGIDVDHVILHSTHTHMAFDSIGLWGPTLTRTGYSESVHAELRSRVADTIEAAIEALEPVELIVGEVDVASYSAESGVTNVVYDIRDPWVIDDTLGAARFVGRDGDTVASIVSYGIHPETMLGRTALLTSDFAHALRETVESGPRWDAYERDGIGGVSLFVNSTVGGMMTTLRLTTVDPDGNAWGPSGSWEKTDAIGQQLGEMALDALESGEQVADPDLSFRTSEMFLPVENIGFQAMGQLGVMARSRYNFDETIPLDDDNQPDILTEVSVLNIGPIQFLAMPGEVLPEVAIGGYDGSYVNAPGKSVITRPDAENPPDLSLAPQGPYLKDEMTGGYNWVIGLANDEVGYIIPAYNFVLDDNAPYVIEAGGDHYEETRSLGPDTADLLQERARALHTWVRPE